jgi:hypothetical protein
VAEKRCYEPPRTLAQRRESARRKVASLAGGTVTCPWPGRVQSSTSVPLGRRNTTLRDQAGIIAFNWLTPGANTAAFLEDSDFVKFRELSVGFSAPSQWTQGWPANLRLTLSGRNWRRGRSTKDSTRR